MMTSSAFGRFLVIHVVSVGLTVGGTLSNFRSQRPGTKRPSREDTHTMTDPDECRFTHFDVFRDCFGSLAGVGVVGVSTLVLGRFVWCFVE